MPILTIGPLWAHSTAVARRTRGASRWVRSASVPGGAGPLAATTPPYAPLPPPPRPGACRGHSPARNGAGPGRPPRCPARPFAPQRGLDRPRAAGPEPRGPTNGRSGPSSSLHGQYPRPSQAPAAAGPRTDPHPLRPARVGVGARAALRPSCRGAAPFAASRRTTSAARCAGLLRLPAPARPLAAIRKRPRPGSNATPRWGAADRATRPAAPPGTARLGFSELRDQGAALEVTNIWLTIVTSSANEAASAAAASPKRTSSGTSGAMSCSSVNLTRRNTGSPTTAPVASR